MINNIIYLRANILNFKTLAVKSFSNVSTYTIKKDIYTNSKSKFILTNSDVDVESGDLVYITDQSNNKFFTGIVDTVDQSTFVTLNCYQIKSVLSLNIKETSFTSTNIATYLINSITNNFINSSDTGFNKDFIELSDNTPTPVMGGLDFDDNYTTNFLTLLLTVYNTYGLYLDFDIDLNNQKLLISVENKFNTYTLKDNIYDIKNISITEKTKQSTNRVDLYPKVENTTSLTEVSYYLLTDDTITTDSTNTNRIYPAINKVVFYKDDADLEQLALQDLKSNIYNHLITFDWNVDSSILTFENDFDLYDTFTLLLKDKTYKSLLTGYSISSNTKIITLTFGKVRILLTDQINKLGGN